MSALVHVVFRKWKKTGEVIALFPHIAWSEGFCTSYLHVGLQGCGSRYGSGKAG